MDEAGRVVVITGATGGLGGVAARAFAARGAAVALLSSDQAKLDALVHELELSPERSLAHAADLLDPTLVQKAAQAIRDKFGPANILLHLVGGWVGGKTLVETEAADLETMLKQHVWTTFHLLQAFVPQLTAAGQGRVLVVSSPLALRPAAKSGAYATAKAAQEAMVLALAQETRERGVTANIVHVRTIDVEHKRESQPSPSNAGWTTPEEITAALLYLCSAEAAMVTGQRLSLAGGAL